MYEGIQDPNESHVHSLSPMGGQGWTRHLSTLTTPTPELTPNTPTPDIHLHTYKSIVSQYLDRTGPTQANTHQKIETKYLLPTVSTLCVTLYMRVKLPDLTIAYVQYITKAARDVAPFVKG